MENLEQLTSNPKFTVRYTLGLFVLSNWLYNTLVVGDSGIADFNQISSEVFNDNMFYTGAFNQMSNLVADLSDTRVIDEMMTSKTFLLDKTKLKDMLNLDETKMKSLAEEGVSIYDMMLTKKLAENCIFDEDVMPTEYTCIDGSDKTAQDTSIPLSLVFSVDSTLLEWIAKILDMDNTAIVKETIEELKKDDKLKCFKNTFNFLELIDKKQ